MKRTILVFTLVFILLVAAFGTLSVSATSAVTNLSIQTTNANPVTDQKFYVYGWLTDAKTTARIPGQTIKLTYSTDGGSTWTDLATVQTDKNGMYAYTTTALPGYDADNGPVPQTYLAHAHFDTSGGYAASDAELTGLVSPADTNISVATSPATPVVGQKVAIYGWVTNAQTGKRLPNVYVIIYVLDNSGSFAYWNFAATDANGFYSFSVTFPEASDDYVIWPLCSGDTSHYPNINNFIAPFTVNPANTKLSLQSWNPAPAANKPFTVYGWLTNKQTGARMPNEPSSSITVSYSTDGGTSWTAFPSTWGTDANAFYAPSITLPHGTYLIKAHFAGDGNYVGTDSLSIPVTVT